MMGTGGWLLVQLMVFVCVTNNGPVSGVFVLTVKFINYTNPSGLCAECNTTFTGNTTLDQIVPVCCDEMPLKTENCDNTGEARCETRFRWILRPFGASLETRPGSVRNADAPPYNFNPCPASSTTCPFSEVSKTFEEGTTAFLERPNPLPVVSTEPWTGEVQFFIEIVEGGVPRIIDSLLINLDNLQLGADFTEEMTFTGYHNISYLTMSFKVECAPNNCGTGCLTTHMSTSVIACQPDGSVVCNDSTRDISTDCTTCLQAGYDLDSNCTQCLPNRDPSTNCTSCSLPRLDMSTNCTTCLQPGYDLDSNCTQCLPNRDPSTNCTSCLSGYNGDSCSPDTLGSAVAGAVVGGLIGVTVLVVVVIVIIFLVIIVFKQSKKPDTKTAVNMAYQQTEPQSRSPEPPPADEPSTSNERDFQNPLYGPQPVPDRDNDYSSPWDSRTDESAKPVVISSPNSSHAIAKRVNSSEIKNMKKEKKTSVKNMSQGHKSNDHSVEYAEIGTSPNKGSGQGKQVPAPVPMTVYDVAETPQGLIPSTNVYDYAEPGRAPDPIMPAPTYDYTNGPSPPPTGPPNPVQAYEYNPLPGFADEQEERSFDNTGASGVYTYSSAPYYNTVPGVISPEAEQHYDMGN